MFIKVPPLLNEVEVLKAARAVGNKESLNLAKK